MTYIYVDALSVPQEYVCELCRLPWDPESAVTCPVCSTVFDTHCAVDRLMKHQTCPATGCGAVWPDVEPLPRPHRTVLSLADAAVEVHCHHHRQGCAWTGPRSRVVPHQGACKFASPAYVYADAVPADLTCPVCHNGIVHPLMPRDCGHVGCGPCVSAAVARHGRCPVCAAPATSADIVSAPRIIASACDRLIVLCGNATNGCLWKGPREHFAVHMQSCVGQPQAAPPMPKPNGDVDKRTRLQLKLDPSTIRPGCPDAQRVTALVTLFAPTVDATRRFPVRLVLAVDTSMSMKGQRLSHIIEAINFIIQELHGNDEIGVVSFDTTVRVVLPLQRVRDEKEKSAARLSVMSGLRAEGATHFSGGLLCALEQLAVAGSNPTADYVRAVFVFTDGKANIGITKTPELLSALEAATRNAPHVSIYTFGFGAEPNAELLRAVSEASQGAYCYIDREEEFREGFANALGGLIFVALRDIALSVAISIEGDEAATITSVLTPYALQRVAHREIAVTVAEMFSEERRDFLVELDIVTSKIVGSKPVVVRASLKCRDVSEPSMETTMIAEETLAVSASKPSSTPYDIIVQRLRWAMVTALSLVIESAEAKRFGPANEIITKYLGDLMRTFLEREDHHVLTRIKKIQVNDEKSWAAQGRHTAHEALFRNKYQRSTGTGDRSDSYSSPPQIYMRDRARLPGGVVKR